MMMIIIKKLYVHFTLHNLDLTAVLKCETIRAGVLVERLHRGDVAVPPEHVLAEHHVGQGRGQACGSLRSKVVVMFYFAILVVFTFMVSLTETVPETFESTTSSGRLPDKRSISTHRRPDT